MGYKAGDSVVDNEAALVEARDKLIINSSASTYINDRTLS